ncbi:hypothetical protein AQB9606_03043 [Aquabacterium sp. CECT 9606]|nr:hypothetical protein AQB9606_03043 [Aquabacterium sp. CECT 9606]
MLRTPVRLTCSVRLLVAFNQQSGRSLWPLMLPPFDRFSALLSLALMHCAFWPGPAPRSTGVRNAVAQQVSIWLSALWQPAHRNAAPKCHMPPLAGFLSFGSQHKVISWPRLPRPSPSRSQALAVVHGLAFSKAGSELGARQESSVKRSRLIACCLRSGQAQAHKAKSLHAHKGSPGMPPSSIQQQSKACVRSSAVPSRPSLTCRSSRHLQAPLVGSLRASRSGAAYLWR